MLVNECRISISELLDRLAERERRQSILRQYNSRMAEVLADPNEREIWRQEIEAAEVSAEGTMRERASAIAR